MGRSQSFFAGYATEFAIVTTSLMGISDNNPSCRIPCVASHGTVQDMQTT